MPTLYQEARAALEDGSFKPKKRLGQNFLVHETVLDAIIRVVDPRPEDEILEIGPGLGSLTRRLLAQARRVWAVEVDRTLMEKLVASLGAHPGLELIQGDILKVPLETILPPRKIKLVANLPYSISTPVLFRLFELRDRFSFLVLMVQREVADRMAALPGSKSYGSLSVWCQVHGKITAKIPVAPEAFFPRPKVRSMVLKIDLHPAPLVTAEDLPLFRDLVRAAFGRRRKTLQNNLTAWLKAGRDRVDALLRAERIDPRRRGETLSLDEFIRLAGAVKQSGLIAES